MATDIGVGDSEVPRLTVTPYDDDTAVTLIVTGPGGISDTLSPYVVGAADDTQTWVTTPVTYTAPGLWLLTWDVTGTGAGRETQEVRVTASPLAGGPAWLPGRSRVANYVPSRTLGVDSETHELTFNSSTRPTGVMVDRLLADAAARIAGRASPVHSSLHETAAVVAALFAAAAVERGWPDDDNTQASLQRANDLERQANTALAELARANEAASGGDATDPEQANALAPVWSFPAPVPWGDSLL